MITKITVDGFKSLAGFEIELGQVNVLIGANGSGKTNILEAIGVLGAAARGGVDDEALLRRGVRLSGPGRYQSRLAEVATEPTITMEAEWTHGGDAAGYRVALDPPANGNVWRYAEERGFEGDRPVLDRADAANGHLDPEAGWAALKAVELATGSPIKALRNWLDQYALYAATTPALRGTVPDLQQREPLGLSGGGLAEAVWLLVRWKDKLAVTPPEPPPVDEAGRAVWRHIERVLDEALALVDWASNFGVEERSSDLIAASVPSGRAVLHFTDRFMDPRWRRLGVYECSEGVLYVFLAAVLATRLGGPQLVAIDDFDHALNPRLARALVERFCGWMIDNPLRGQVLITTHNPLLLDGLDLANNDIRLFAVDRTSKGRTIARRVVVDQKLMEKSEGEWPLSRLWVRGEIGGMPRV